MHHVNMMDDANRLLPMYVDVIQFGIYQIIDVVYVYVFDRGGEVIYALVKQRAR